MAIVSPNTDGTYTKPASGTPLYLAYQSAANLPSDWGYCMSTASTLDTASMGTMKSLGAPAGGGIEVEYQGAAPIIGDDGTITCGPVPGGTQYRSEVVFQSDRAGDYTNFRFVEGQRIRIAFDVMTLGLDAQTGVNWNSIFQSIRSPRKPYSATAASRGPPLAEGPQRRGEVRRPTGPGSTCIAATPSRTCPSSPVPAR